MANTAEIVPEGSGGVAGWLTVSASLLSYLVVSGFLFGGPLKPLWLVFFVLMPDWGAPLWQVPALGAIAASTLVFSTSLGRQWKWPLFIALALSLPVLVTAAYAGMLRQIEIARFAPEAHFQHSFFQSLHHAPGASNTFMHGAALKDCKAYLWSYGEMRFVEMTPGRGNSNLPRAWHRQCSGLLSLPEV